MKPNGRNDRIPVIGKSTSSLDSSQVATLDLGVLPFEARLSLRPLLSFWEEAGTEAGMEPVAGLGAERIRAELDRNPWLAEPIEDPLVLRDHRAFLDLLMAPVFPPAFRDRDLAAALIPFQPRAFYATPSFDRLLTREDGTISGRVNLDLRTFTYGKLLTAYLHILRSVYGIDVPFDSSTIFSTEDPETGLDRSYKITMDLRFLHINLVGEAPPLPDEAKRRLFDNLTDLRTWIELIPPGAFEFSGFGIIRATDVTDQEVVSALKHDLLEGESIVTGSPFPTLLERLRILLRKDRLRFCLAAVDAGQLIQLHRPTHTHPDCLFRRARHYELAELEGTLFGRCIRDRAMQVVEDLAAFPEAAPIETEMLEAGVRNVVAAPLFAGEELVGVLYLWAEEPGALNALDAMKLVEVLPLFSAAVKRGKSDLQSRVQAVILGRYTAIHPSVEWRFRKAALSYLNKVELGRPAEVEPIIFRDVFPLYAATDIRASSTHRNAAVQADLLDQLGMAEAVLHSAREIRPLPILDHLIARAGRFRESLQTELTSSDEASAREFLRRDVEPLFSHMRALDQALDEQIRVYQAMLDPQHGGLYSRQRDYDESVGRINRTISDYLDLEERRAQEMFPHYFERHQTDGIEFSIYVGPSLQEDRRFDPIYVRNLRLWQLMVMCGIVRLVEPLKSDLAVPLETTHLILAQSNPLTIRFRFDETRFDVDGSYNVFYEIMKRRIDKAMLKGRSERLTQPGKIAVVYAQARDAWEYEEYIDSLQASGYLTEHVEEVTLADMPGVRGLRALRVGVVMEDPPSGHPVAAEAVARMARG